MGRPKQDQSDVYLILDRNTYESVGTITGNEARDELGITSSQFNYFIQYGKTFRGKYILVEDKFGENSKEDEEIYSLFHENDMNRHRFKGAKYYVTSKGRFVRVFNGKEKELAVWRHHSKWMIRVGYKELIASRIYAKAFLGMKDSQECHVVGDKWDISQIKVGTPRQIRSYTGGLNGKCVKVGLYVDGKCIKKYRSMAECGRDIGFTKEGVRFIVHGKSKHPQYDIRRI